MCGRHAGHISTIDKFGPLDALACDDSHCPMAQRTVPEDLLHVARVSLVLEWPEWHPGDGLAQGSIVGWLKACGITTAAHGSFRTLESAEHGHCRTWPLDIDGLCHYPAHRPRGINESAAAQKTNSNQLLLGNMKNAFISLTVLTVVLGCSKESPMSAIKSEGQKQPDLQTVASPKPIDPGQIIVVETAERKDSLKIEAEAAAGLAAKNFTMLEELANQYRTSKSCYANGSWKLTSVYSGMFPRDDQSDAEWKTSLATLRDWVQASPDSITARVALADALVAYGWKARGDGLANTVTETGWKLLAERLTEAVQVLKQAEALHGKCPHSWTVLLRAATGLAVEKPQYESLFHKAISFEPDYTGYYCQMTRYLLSRWYGQLGDAAGFLQKAADKIGGEDGDLFYARVTWSLRGGNVFVEDGLSWERADRGFQVLEKRFPDSLFVRNARAYIAVMGCEKTLAPRKLVDGLHGKIDTSAWTSKENFIRLTRDLYPH